MAASGYGGSGYVIPTWLDSNGKPNKVPGITTITGAIGDKEGLIQFNVDQTAAYAVANVDKLYSMSEDQGFGLLRWYHKRNANFDEGGIFDYHRGVLNDSADLGTLTHEWIQADLVGEFTPEITSEPMAQMVDQWLRFKSEHTVIPNLIESTAFNTDAGYAGTLDLHANIDGTESLVDIKTARSTREGHKAQLAALGACYFVLEEVDSDTPGAVRHHSTKWGETWWVEKELPTFSQYAILHVRPDDWDSKGNSIPAFCKMKTIDHIDAYYEAFLTMRQHKEAMRKIKKLEE